MCKNSWVVRYNRTRSIPQWYHGSSGGGMGWNSLCGWGGRAAEVWHSQHACIYIVELYGIDNWIWRVAYKLSGVVVDSTPVIFVSDSLDSSVDSRMSDIVIESNSSIYFSGKWYLQVFYALISCWNSRKITKVSTINSSILGHLLLIHVRHVHHWIRGLKISSKHVHWGG